MKASSDTFEQDLRRIIREEVQPIVHKELQQEVRPIIREETQLVRDDITTIKSIVGSHDLRLKTITSELSSLKTTMRAQVGETKSLGVLLEDLEYRFAAAHE